MNRHDRATILFATVHDLSKAAPFIRMPDFGKLAVPSNTCNISSTIVQYYVAAVALRIFHLYHVNSNNSCPIPPDLLITL
jgi:hypothetical protein